MSAWSSRINRVVAIAALAAAPFVAQADAYYASFANQGVFGLGRYPLTPNSFGTAIGYAGANPHDLTIAGNQLYWLDGNSIYRANLDGSNRVQFQSFGIAPTGLEVDFANSFYYASFANQGVFGLGRYPLTPNSFGTAIGYAGANPHDLTLAGDQFYWLDGTGVYRSNLDGSSRTLFQSFGIAPLSLEVDAAAGFYYATFANQDVFGIGRYPLVPNSFGTAIGYGGSGNVEEITLAGGQLWWLDGTQIYRADPDGSGRTVFQTFGISPVSLAVDVAVAVVPEPPTWLLAALSLPLLAWRFRHAGREG
jgi:hypothetical protein